MKRLFELRWILNGVALPSLIMIFAGVSPLPAWSHSHYYGYGHHGYTGYHNYYSYPGHHHGGYQFGYHSAPYRHYSAPYRHYSAPYRHYSTPYHYSSRGHSGYAYEGHNDYDHARTYRVPSHGGGSDYRVAWVYLARGDHDQALEAFARLASESPQSGPPKIGYGLSAALRGDYETGVYALRRAFRYDPEGASHIPAIAGLEEKLYYLSSYYSKQAEADPHNGDAYFMLAALSYLRHDYATAGEAAEKAIAYGDDSPSTRNLGHLITRSHAVAYTGS